MRTPYASRAQPWRNGNDTPSHGHHHLDGGDAHGPDGLHHHECRTPRDQHRPGGDAHSTRVDTRRLRGRLRDASHHRRSPGRHLRTTTHLPRGRHRLHVCLRVRLPVLGWEHPHSSPDHSGGLRRHHGAAGAVQRSGHVHARRAGAGIRCHRIPERPGRDSRTSPGRLARHGKPVRHGMAQHLPHQCPGGHCPDSHGIPVHPGKPLRAPPTTWTSSAQPSAPQPSFSSFSR